MPLRTRGWTAASHKAWLGEAGDMRHSKWSRANADSIGTGYALVPRALSLALIRTWILAAPEAGEAEHGHAVAAE